MDSESPANVMPSIRSRNAKEARFFVPGKPQPKGSTKSWIHPQTKRVITTTTNKNLPQWESDVKRFAIELWGGEPSRESIQCSMSFYFTRPKSHFRTGKFAGIIKPTAPNMIAKPDLDKLIRAVLDGLTGVVFVDDAQVLSIDAVKMYASQPGVGIHVTETVMEIILNEGG